VKIWLPIVSRELPEVAGATLVQLMYTMLCTLYYVALVDGNHFSCAADLCTEMLDVRGFDSNRVFTSKDGMLMHAGVCTERLNQHTSAGVILARILGLTTMYVHTTCD